MPINIPDSVKIDLQDHKISISKDNKELFWGGVNVFSESQKKQILNNTSDYDTYYQFVDPQYKNFYKKNHNSDFINRMTYLDLKHRLPELLLMRIDKMAMASSVETRVPYLDHKLVEFCTVIPSKMKLKGLTTKKLIKNIMKNELPEKVRLGRKKGFSIPLNRWFRQDFNVLTDEYLSTERLNRNGYFNSSFIENLIKEHSCGFKDNSKFLWTLVAFEIWHKQYMN